MFGLKVKSAGRDAEIYDIWGYNRAINQTFTSLSATNRETETETENSETNKQRNEQQNKQSVN